MGGGKNAIDKNLFKYSILKNRINKKHSKQEINNYEAHYFGDILQKFTV